jgi:ABC-2 type transport system ATP-binding protein
VGLADVVRTLDQQGVAVEEIDLRTPTLDDVFLAKTGHKLEGAGEEDA